MEQKRPRLEPRDHPLSMLRNAENIIQGQMKVIEKLKARNQQLEEQLKDWESSKSKKIPTVPIPELPNEIWLEIISYLSTYDILRNVAQVSKRFHKLSEDPHVIRNIEVNSSQFLVPKDQLWTVNEEKFCNDAIGVLKRSVKLKKLSVGCWDIVTLSGQKFLEALPFMNHQLLQEICLKSDGEILRYLKYPSNLEHNLFKYLEECPELKVLKFEFKPVIEWKGEDKCLAEYPFLSSLEKGITCIKLKNLRELHLIGVDIFNFVFGKFLETITENLPKLQRLCMTCQYAEWEPGWNDIFQAYASEKNIKLEISSILRCKCGHASWVEPTMEMNIFRPR